MDSVVQNVAWDEVGEDLVCQARKLSLLIRPGHFWMGSEKGSEVTGVQKNLSFGSDIWEAKDAVGGEPGKERR